MYITDDGIRLNAALDMPEGGAGRCPLVIVLHGYSGHSEERHIAAAAKLMNELGYATLRVDLYGHGKSDGEFVKHTLFKWMTNAMTVIDYARSLPFVTELYLCGHSQGGLTVMLAAALKHDVIRGILLLSPAWMIPELARKGELRGVPFDPEHIPDTLTERKGRVLGGNYIRVAQTIHVEEAIRRFDGPVLLVQGDADEAVPLRYAREAAGAYRDARLVVIPGDTHCYDRHLDEVLEAIRQWLPRP